MKYAQAFYRLNFVHACFFGYVQRAKSKNENTTILTLAQEFCDSQKCQLDSESLARTYYSTIKEYRSLNTTPKE